MILGRSALAVSALSVPATAAKNGVCALGQGPGRGGGSEFFVKDVLFDRLQFGDLACHLLQAGRELIDAMRCLLLTGGNTVADANGEPVDTSPHRVEIKATLRWTLLLIGSRKRLARSAVWPHRHRSAKRKWPGRQREKHDQVVGESEASDARLPNDGRLVWELVTF